MNGERARVPVSIVCVSNSSQVLNDCLIKSVSVHQTTAPETELIVVPNSHNEFSTAGAALNHGVSLARNSVCAFVHQDVYLHSLVKLEEAAAASISDRSVGLVGATGMAPNGALLGRIRDRVVVTGRAVDGFSDVDSVDELLFMVQRQRLIEGPLSEDPNLAWHAYAVEYGARVRRSGERVVVGDIPVSHNSLTTNLKNLAEGHGHVGQHYPEQLPIVTTCGVITGAARARPRFLAKHRWRHRQLKDSRAVCAMKRGLGSLPVVLSDIRMDIDQVLEASGETRLSVVSLESAAGRRGDLAQPIELDRLGRAFSFRALTRQELLAELAGDRRRDESILVTSVDRSTLQGLRACESANELVLGFSQASGPWVLLGPAAKASPEAWQRPSARPVGIRKRS